MLDAWVLPTAVPAGGRIGVFAPAAPANRQRVEQGALALRQAGFEVEVSPLVDARAGLFAGDDAARAKELIRMILDPDIDAVIAARGGYGCMRLLPLLEGLWSRLRTNHKPLVGFSDLTALHLGLQRNKLVSLHGPVVETLVDPEGGIRQESCARLVQALTSAAPLPPLVAGLGGAVPRCVVPGQARGRLVGGNLSLISATLGTPWEIDTAGAIVLLEDVGEAPYRLDRYLAQMHLADKLRPAAGFVLGRLVDCGSKDDDPSGEAVFEEWLGPLGVPCSADWPVGHGGQCLTLAFGVTVELDASAGVLGSVEAGVRR